MSGRSLLRKLRALNGPGCYPPPPSSFGPQDPREALAEALDYRRTILTEELLKISIEDVEWGSDDEEGAIRGMTIAAKACAAAAGVIYPELEPETAWVSQRDLLTPAPVPPPTREGMMSVAGREEASTAGALRERHEVLPPGPLREALREAAAMRTDSQEGEA